MRSILTAAAAVAFAGAPALAQNAGTTRVRTQTPAGTQIVPGTQQAGERVIAPGTQQAGQVGGRVNTGTIGTGRVGTAGVGAPAGATRTAVNDALFAAAATDGNLTELSLSQLGMQKATDPELRQFSQHMIDEHNRLGQEMSTLAAQKGMRVPAALDVRSQFCAQSLAGLSGEKFDCCYAKAQLVLHMDSLAAFEAEAQRGMDPDMKALAARMVPKIKGHLEQIKPIARRFMQKEEGEHPSNNSRIGAPGGEHSVR